MRTRFKKIIKKAKGVLLSSEEKEFIKASLLKHMESHPLTKESGNFTVHKQVSYTEWVGNYFHNKRMWVPSALLLLVVLTTGVSFASTNVLPGSFLYPVKILKEKMSLALATSPEEKVGLLAMTANTRLEEAEALYASGELDQNTETNLAKSFEDDSVRVSVSLEHMKGGNRIDSNQIVLNFKNNLERHQKIINNLNQNNSTASSSIELGKVINNVISKFDPTFNLTHKIDFESDKPHEARWKSVYHTSSKATEFKDDNEIATTSVLNIATSTSAVSTTSSSTDSWHFFENSNTLYKGPEILKQAEGSTSTQNLLNVLNGSRIHVQTNLNTKIHIPGLH